MSNRVGNRLLREMRAEVVTKDDGRYLIFYSWPTDYGPGEPVAQRRTRRRRPTQPPWSPETAPTDV